MLPILSGGPRELWPRSTPGAPEVRQHPSQDSAGRWLAGRNQSLHPVPRGEWRSRGRRLCPWTDHAEDHPARRGALRHQCEELGLSRRRRKLPAKALPWTGLRRADPHIDPDRPPASGPRPGLRRERRIGAAGNGLDDEVSLETEVSRFAAKESFAL
jgi:hypothetical protein